MNVIRPSISTINDVLINLPAYYKVLESDKVYQDDEAPEWLSLHLKAEYAFMDYLENLYNKAKDGVKRLILFDLDETLMSLQNVRPSARYVLDLLNSRDNITLGVLTSREEFDVPQLELYFQKEFVFLRDSFRVSSDLKQEEELENLLRLEQNLKIKQFFNNGCVEKYLKLKELQEKFKEYRIVPVDDFIYSLLFEEGVWIDQSIAYWS